MLAAYLADGSLLGRFPVAMDAYTVARAFRLCGVIVTIRFCDELELGR